MKGSVRICGHGEVFPERGTCCVPGVLQGTERSWAGVSVGG